MKMQSTQSKNGGILLMVALVMLLVSVLSIGLFKLSGTYGVETLYVEQSKKAFWMAEAGLQDAINRINWLAAYRNSPNSYTNDYGNGASYEVSVPDVSPDFLASSESINYTIVSIGRSHGVNRRLQQVVSVSPGFKFPLDIENGEIVFNSNSKVEGSVIVRDGSSIDTGNNDTVVITDYLYADGDSISGDGSYIQAPIPPINAPFLNTSKYTDEISGVYQDLSGPSVTDKTTTSIPSNVTYSNSVTFAKSLTVDSDVSITGVGNLTFKNVTFSGPVNIVAGGDVKFSSKVLPLPAGSTVTARGTIDVSGSSEIGEGVSLVAGTDVLLGSQTVFGGGAVVYADRNLTVASGSENDIDVSGYGIALLSNGNITINSGMNPFKGIIYANGTVSLNANMTISGSVISKERIIVASNVDFFTDASVCDWDLAGIGISVNDVLVMKRTWQELPPL